LYLHVGVKAIISMNEEYELTLTSSEEEWAKYGVQVLRLPTQDLFAAPSQVIILFDKRQLFANSFNIEI